MSRKRSWGGEEGELETDLSHLERREATEGEKQQEVKRQREEKTKKFGYFGETVDVSFRKEEQRNEG